MSKGIVYKNFTGNPGRSSALVLLSVVLSFAILAGALVLSGLQNGLNSLDQRLGADLMVVPYSASTENYLEDSILMGNTGYYYMPDSKEGDIKSKIEGVEKVSGQIFLATTTSSCCSYKVSVVGFDPKTDFTITPWVERSYSGKLKNNEVFVGHDLNAYAGDTLKFFGVPVKVAARLDKTGTYLDTAVYTNTDTAKEMVRRAEKKKLFSNAGYDIDPAKMVSCVLVKLKDGYSTELATGEIKTYISNVAVVKTETSVSDVSDKLQGISKLSALMIAVVWVLMFVIEFMAFSISFNTRKKEFAVMRMAGASRRRLSGIVINEALLISGIGSAVGCALAVLLASLFSQSIGSSLNMPFLLPAGWKAAAIILASFAASVLAGVLASASFAKKAGKTDAALILSGDQ